MPEKDFCQREVIAPYLDGELDERAKIAFEEHLRVCADCAAALKADRLFLHELDTALAQDPEVPAPNDFVRIVAAHAESDMSGVRSVAEHKKALRFAIILALFSLAFLGTSASDFVIGGGRIIVSRVIGLGSVLSRTVFDAASSAAVISKALGRKFVVESGSLGLLVVFLGLALLLLSRLIANYHRARAIE